MLFTGEGGKEGYLSFPSCTSSRTQIGTEGWAVSPGISVLPSVPTPSEGNLPADLHSRRPLCVSEHEPGSPGESNPPTPPLPPPTLQLTRHHGWWWTLLLCCFSAASSFPASWRPRGAVDGAVPQRPRRCRGAPRKGYENSCRRMKNSCGITVYLSIPDSSSPPLCPLCLSF